MRWLDGRDDLRWWQHRHPDPRMRKLGAAIMAVGALQSGLGALLLLHSIGG